MIRVTMTSELSYQCNDAFIYFTCSSISWHWELFFQNRSEVGSQVFVTFIKDVKKFLPSLCKMSTVKT